MARFGFFKKPKFWVPLVIILVVILATVGIIRNMNQPAVGSISQQPTTDAVKADPYSQPGKYSGKYITFNYPAHYKQVPSKVSGTTLELAEYHVTDATGKLISVAVFPGSVNSDSGVVYRRQHPELYTESSSQKWTEFTKKDGTEDTFFLSHNGNLATVSCTAPYNNQSGDALFVASSLQWKQ